jgi:hypothetical protein
VEITVVMSTIAEPSEGSRTVMLIAEGTGTVVIRGDAEEAPLTLLCGNCSAILGTRMCDGQLGRVVLKCNQCGAFNETID